MHCIFFSFCHVDMHAWSHLLIRYYFLLGAKWQVYFFGLYDFNWFKRIFCCFRLFGKLCDVWSNSLKTFALSPKKQWKGTFKKRLECIKQSDPLFFCQVCLFNFHYMTILPVLLFLFDNVVCDNFTYIAFTIWQLYP